MNKSKLTLVIGLALVLASVVSCHRDHAVKGGTQGKLPPLHLLAYTSRERRQRACGECLPPLKSPNHLAFSRPQSLHGGLSAVRRIGGKRLSLHRRAKQSNLQLPRKFHEASRDTGSLAERLFRVRD